MDQLQYNTTRVVQQRTQQWISYRITQLEQYNKGPNHGSATVQHSQSSTTKSPIMDQLQYNTTRVVQQRAQPWISYSTTQLKQYNKGPNNGSATVQHSQSSTTKGPIMDQLQYNTTRVVQQRTQQWISYSITQLEQYNKGPNHGSATVQHNQSSTTKGPTMDQLQYNTARVVQQKAQPWISYSITQLEQYNKRPNQGSATV